MPKQAESAPDERKGPIKQPAAQAPAPSDQASEIADMGLKAADTGKKTAEKPKPEPRQPEPKKVTTLIREALPKDTPYNWVRDRIEEHRGSATLLGIPLVVRRIPGGAGFRVYSVTAKNEGELRDKLKQEY